MTDKTKSTKFAGKWRPVNQLQPAYDPTLEPTLAELRAKNEQLWKVLDHIRLLLTNAPGDTARREAVGLAVHTLRACKPRTSVL